MHTKKHKFLTLKEKSEILEHLGKGASVTNLANKFGVKKSTICGIKKIKILLLNVLTIRLLDLEKEKLCGLPSTQKWRMHYTDGF